MPDPTTRKQIGNSLARVLTILVAGTTGLQAAETPKNPPAPGWIESRQIRFTTDDDVNIFGTYYPPQIRGKHESAPICILLPAEKQDRRSFEALTPHLHRAGFAVLAIDLRGHGESAAPPETKRDKKAAEGGAKDFKQMYRDVEAAYLWLVEQPNVDLARFVLIGAGSGGNVALDYAVRDRSVDAVVILTPTGAAHGIGRPEDLEKYGKRPLLLLTGPEDRSEADQLARAVADTTLKIVTNPSNDARAIQGTRMLGLVPEVESSICEFLLKAAGDPSDKMVVASRIGRVYYDPESSPVKRLSSTNLRRYSSAAEAEQRGYRRSKSWSRKADR